MMKTFLFVLAALATTASALEMCSERAFQTAIENAPKTAASVGCQRAVFFSLCEECGRDLGCYMSNAPKIAPTLPACQFPARRQLRSSSRCSEATFQKAVAAAPNTGAALGCQRAVYNELCDKCGEDQECFWKYGRKIAPTLQQCRPRRLTSYEMDVEEDVGGVGRFCATAACLFIDNLSPPPPRYRPGSPGPAPIHRPLDEMDDEEVGGRVYSDNDEMDDEEVGGRAGRCFAIGACLFIDNLSPPPPRYRPGSPGPAPIHRPLDEMEDEEVGGAGRCIAIAACLFIDGLNPPPARYRPGSPGPAPIGRLYDEDEMDDEMDDEFTGHYKLPHDNHNPQGWPGHDEMEDEAAGAFKIGNGRYNFNFWGDEHEDVYDEEAGQQKRWQHEDFYDEEAGRRPGSPGPMPGQGPRPIGGNRPPIGNWRL